MIRLPGELPASAAQRLLDQLMAVAQAMTEPPKVILARIEPPVAQAVTEPVQAKAAPTAKRAAKAKAAPPSVRHLTPEQLAERLGKPVGTLKRWRRTRTGPPFMHVGRDVRYRLTDVEAWEKTRLVTTAA
jgi:hypothetical protein